MTGGAGFVGSHTVLVLLQNGFKVVVVDNLVNAVSEGISLLRPLFTNPDFANDAGFQGRSQWHFSESRN